MLSYLYPRIDSHVSTSINHLLKAPFCVHPKTGNVCVPFDPMNYEKFDLSNLPTLTKSINELSSLAADKADEKMDDGEIVTKPIVPCMQRATEIFKKHIRACVQKQHRATAGDDDIGGIEDQAIKF